MVVQIHWLVVRLSGYFIYPVLATLVLEHLAITVVAVPEEPLDTANISEKFNIQRQKSSVDQPPGWLSGAGGEKKIITAEQEGMDGTEAT